MDVKEVTIEQDGSEVLSTGPARRFKAYPDYKESGIVWLEEIPAHWVVHKLKRISPVLTVGIVVNPSNYVSDDGVPFLYGSDVREGLILADGARKMSSEMSDKLYKSQLPISPSRPRIRRINE